MGGADLHQVGQGVPDGQEGVFAVQPLGLAGGAQVVVRTHRALEACAGHRALAAVACDVGMHGGWARVRRGRARVRRGRGMRHAWAGRRGKGEGWDSTGEGVEREVTPVLLLLWNTNQRKLYE